MLRHGAVVCLIALAAPLSLAAPAAADTILHLAETATVTVPPDELDATLRVEAMARSAAEAQAQVNGAMQAALQQAHQVTGVTVSTGSYAAWQTGNTPQERAKHWQVSQTLNLTSHDGVALLALVGRLQERGLAVGNLAWRLSREAEKNARQAATKQALAALRDRISDAADLLGLRFAQFKEVRLDGTGAFPVPRMAPAMMMTAAPGAAPPAAETQNVPVSATAEADAILVPR
jgi:predicted secreted protein